MSQKTLGNSTFSGNDVPKLTRILYPWSGIFRDACYALIGTFLMQYAISSGVLSSNPTEFQAQYGVITIAMMIALLWDGINDPIMGFILEKCHFKTGKFRPWIQIGAIGNALVVILMFLVPMFVGAGWGWGYVGFMIAMYVLWDTCFTMNDIGYWSMLPALTNDPQQRAKLTTHTAIAASIGTFFMNIAMFVLPGIGLGSTIQVYALAGISIAVLFLVSQTLVFFLCKEKVRDAEQEEVSEKSSILDLFRVVMKNKELLYAAIGMFLYYFASFILTGIGQNYFYIQYGYGGTQGGMVATVIAAFYVLGTVVAQALYPSLAKKLPKKKILTIVTAIVVVTYLIFFFIAFPVFGNKPVANATVDPNNMFWVFGGTMSLLYVMCFIFFGASGIFYLACLVMFQDAIDFGEWKNGERKESICFAWRPLDVKLASGLNRGLQFAVYGITGTVLAINAISNWEGISNALNNAAQSNAEKSAISSVISSNIASATNGVESWRLTLFGAIVIGVIIVAFVGSYLLLRFGYKLDEKKMEEIVGELNAKKEAEAPKVEEAAQAA